MVSIFKGVYIIGIIFSSIFLSFYVFAFPALTFHEAGHIIIANQFGFSVDKIQYLELGGAVFVCHDWYLQPTYLRVITLYSGGLFSALIFFLLFRYLFFRVYSIDVLYSWFFEGMLIAFLSMIIVQTFNALFEGASPGIYELNKAWTNFIMGWPVVMFSILFYFLHLRQRMPRKK
jgi:hypothetical protein